MSKKEFVCDCGVVHSESVEKVMEAMCEQESYTDLSKFFKIFADETRIKIIAALDISELCVCDICNVLSMKKSAVSHQLATLREMEIVKYRKEGRSIYYSLNDEHVTQVFEMGMAHIAHTKCKGE